MGNIPCSTSTFDSQVQSRMHPNEIKILRRRFEKFTGSSMEATLDQFQRLPELAGNPYVPRIFELMDTDKNGKVSFLEFYEGLSLYQELQETADGRIQLLFLIHDVDNDGKLSAAELTDVMQMSAGSSFTTEQIDEVVKAILKVYDKDTDGFLNISEFSELVTASGATLQL